MFLSSNNCTVVSSISPEELYWYKLLMVFVFKFVEISTLLAQIRYISWNSRKTNYLQNHVKNRFNSSRFHANSINGLFGEVPRKNLIWRFSKCIDRVSRNCNVDSILCALVEWKWVGSFKWDCNKMKIFATALHQIMCILLRIQLNIYEIKWKLSR